MNPFRRAFTHAIKNPKFLLTALAVNLFFTVINKMLPSLVPNAYLADAFSILSNALALLITLTLTVDIHREKPFSISVLSRLPRTAPLFLLCYILLSSIMLASVSLIQRASVLYALINISTFLGFAVPLLVIALAILTAFWLQLYTAFCAYDVPYAFRNAIKMLKHPLALIGIYFKTFWTVLLITYAAYLLNAIPVIGAYIDDTVTIFLAPLTAQLTLSWCDTLCQRYHAHLPRF